MKNKYQRMNKEEKKECKLKYYQTEKGKEMKTRFFRLRLIGIVGTLFAIFLVISGYISDEINWATWLIAIILLIFSLIYFICSFTLKGKCLNNFAVKEMNNKKSKKNRQ